MNPKPIANPISNFSITSKRRSKTASTVTNLLSSLSLTLPLRISTPSTNHQTMGGKRGRTQRRHFKENRENVWKKNKPTSDTNLTDNNDTNSNPNTTTHTPWEAFATRNIVFEEYYKEQGIVSEEEWDAFMNMLRKPLPAAFRINSSGQFWEDIRSQLENDFMKSLEAEENEDGELDAIRPLPWYPDNLAWHSNYSRMQLRKNQTLKRFHEFLKQANEIGNITRQEAVSMVPPLFLDVHQDHFVLDMCAAPGSKTFQLLEIIHQTSDSAFLPTGMVIANDVDVQRCNLLIHQTKRMCSANLIVTNHEAQHFPGCHVNHNTLSKSDTASVNGLGMNQLVFDRVLCDVPCSGDGTLRKAPDIWRKWNAGLGNGVHRLQVQIAMRGIALLKVGGRMVYSTCSMNPVENEAVVAEVLRRCGHSVELLDVSTELPKLARRPGLKKWMVRDRGQWLTSYKDVSEYRKKCGIVPSMFPSGSTCNSEMSATGDLQVDMGPTDNCERESSNTQKTLQNSSTVDTEDVEQSENCTIPTNVVDIEVSSLPLERCMRIVPHDQNSGAFFIAVFQKLSSLPVVLEGDSNLSEQCTNQDHELPKVSEEIREDINELDINPSEDDTNNQKSVIAETVDADIEDKKSEGAIELDIDSLDGEPNEVESKVHGDGETGHEKEKGGKRRLQIQGKWKGVDPVVMFQDEAAISSIRAFYGISESFPFNDHLVARNYDAQRVKRIYYISKSVQDVLKLNIQVGQRLKITSIGLKTFERQTSQEGNASACAYRISSEGLPLLLPYITKQILRASYVDFKHLLQYRTIKFADFVDSGFGENASKLMLGCCVILLNKGDEVNSDPIKVDASTIAVGCWKGKTNISVMLSSADCEELLGRLSARFENKNKEVIHDNKGSIESETTEQATVG